MADAAGIAAYGDEQACRWVAVRHAPDHIHLVAALAGVDGRQPCLRGGILAMHAAAPALRGLDRGPATSRISRWRTGRGRW